MSKVIEQYLIQLSQGPLKRLVVTASGAQLISVDVLFDNEPAPQVSSTTPADAIQQIIQQLKAYHQQAHNHWSVEVAGIGTPYQQKVWRHLQTIPLGTTQTYGEIAAKISSSARAVGNACRANPWLLIIPCHRVVKKNNIGGVGGKIDGEAIMIKQRLLAHER